MAETINPESLHLQQRHLFEKKQLVITEKGVMITSASKGQLSEVLVPFEEITSTVTSFHKSYFWLLVVSVAIALASFLGIIAQGSTLYFFLNIGGLVVSTILLTIYFISRSKFWLIGLTSGTHIIILKQIPNPKKVDDFIRTLFIHRDQYLMKWYGTFRALLPYENQFEQLKFLYALGVIDSDTFDQMNGALMGLYEKKSKVIGFRSKRNSNEEE